MTSEVTVLEDAGVAIVTVVCDRPDGVVLHMDRPRTAGKNLDDHYNILFKENFSMTFLWLYKGVISHYNLYDLINMLWHNLTYQVMTYTGSPGLQLDLSCQAMTYTDSLALQLDLTCQMMTYTGSLGLRWDLTGQVMTYTGFQGLQLDLAYQVMTYTGSLGLLLDLACLVMPYTGYLYM